MKDDPEKVFLGSDDASPENMECLREYIKKTAPLAEPILNTDDMRGYFGRRSFVGGIVTVNKLNGGDYFCLIGDAAHSLIPATGEGINSGMEDCSVLIGIVKELMGSKGVLDGLFEEFNKRRLQNVHGIGMDT